VYHRPSAAFSHVTPAIAECMQGENAPEFSLCMDLSAFALFPLFTTAADDDQQDKQHEHEAEFVKSATVEDTAHHYPSFPRLSYCMCAQRVLPVRSPNAGRTDEEIPPFGQRMDKPGQVRGLVVQ